VIGILYTPGTSASSTAEVGIDILAYLVSTAARNESTILIVQNIVGAQAME